MPHPSSRAPSSASTKTTTRRGGPVCLPLPPPSVGATGGRPDRFPPTRQPACPPAPDLLVAPPPSVGATGGRPERFPPTRQPACPPAPDLLVAPPSVRTGDRRSPGSFPTHTSARLRARPRPVRPSPSAVGATGGRPERFPPTRQPTCVPTSDLSAPPPPP